MAGTVSRRTLGPKGRRHDGWKPPGLKRPQKHSTAQRGIRRILGVLGSVFRWSGWAKVASIATAFTAIAALWFTNQSLSAANDQYRLTQQGQITDRFGKAIEQLGSDKADIRLGGIYSLERLAGDSPPDHPTIFEVLSSFVRTHSPATKDCRTPDFSAKPLTVDVQAALTVIGRRHTENDGPNDVDLSMACLVGARLAGANLRHVNLTNTDLAGAVMNGSILSGTKLDDAILQRADLTGADLSHASLDGTNLADATMDDAKLVGAHTNYMTDFTWSSLKSADLTAVSLTGVTLNNARLDKARLPGANLSYAKLLSARLGSADLTNADLSNAQLQDAVLNEYIGGPGANLTGANLNCANVAGANLAGTNLSDIRFTGPADDERPDGVYFDAKTVWPAGFTPPASLATPCLYE